MFGQIMKALSIKIIDVVNIPQYLRDQTKPVTLERYQHRLQENSAWT